MSSLVNREICLPYVERGICRFGSGCKFSHSPAVNYNSSKSSVKRVKKHKKLPTTLHPKAPQSSDYVDAFFAHYPSFDYDSSKPIWTEFNRMCDHFEWDEDEYRMQKAKRNFKSAMVEQFNSFYGTDVEDQESWRNLCHILKIEPIPSGLKECRERVRKTHVNLVDLVDTPRTGLALEVFSNLGKLQDYTIKTGKYFPKQDAKAGGLLKFLLRRILS